MNTKTSDTLARLKGDIAAFQEIKERARLQWAEFSIAQYSDIIAALIEVCEAARAVVEHECRERGIPTPEPGFSRAATLTDWNAHEVAALAAALENLETGGAE